jgi:hypothetical protein
MMFSDAFTVVVFVVGVLFFAQGMVCAIAKRRTRRERAALRRSAIEWSEYGSEMRPVRQTRAPESLSAAREVPLHTGSERQRQ